jgi:hypothetical protein
MWVVKVWNGMNHWRIPKIISYYPEKTINKSWDFTIEKNVYGEPIQGKKLNVMVRLLQIKNQEQYEYGQIPKDIILGNMRRIEMKKDLNYIHDELWQWADNGYPTKIKKKEDF